MLVLSFDSCGAACAVCVWQDGIVLAQHVEAMQRGQDARLIPMIVDVMQQAQRGFADLDRIAVTRGPGSFTGLRVGLAAAQGIGLAAGKPVLGIDRFALYHALHAADARDLLVVIDSKRAEFFCRFYPRQGAPHAPALMNAEDIAVFEAAHPACSVVGDRTMPQDDLLPLCAALAAAADLQDPQFLPRPLYLRPPDVTRPKSRPVPADGSGCENTAKG